MTKNEALKAAIDGKKVKHKNWERSYVYWNNCCFTACYDSHDNHIFMPSSAPLDGWQILPELVSFDEAWKAYEQGKHIVSIPGDAEYWDTDGIVDAFTSDQIRGKWEILDD